MSQWLTSQRKHNPKQASKPIGYMPSNLLKSLQNQSPSTDHQPRVCIVYSYIFSRVLLYAVTAWITARAFRKDYLSSDPAAACHQSMPGLPAGRFANVCNNYIYGRKDDPRAATIEASLGNCFSRRSYLRISQAQGIRILAETWCALRRTRDSTWESYLGSYLWEERHWWVLT